MGEGTGNPEEGSSSLDTEEALGGLSEQAKAARGECGCNGETGGVGGSAKRSLTLHNIIILSDLRERSKDVNFDLAGLDILCSGGLQCYKIHTFLVSTPYK